MGKQQSTLNQVIAIEIGRVNSGYAYQLGVKNRQTLTATYVYGLPKDRVPTTLLLKPDRTFDSFGNFAKDKYYALALQEHEHGYTYVDKVQIKPTPSENASVRYTADVKMEDSITQEEIYTTIIKYLHERCLHKIKRYGKHEVTDPVLVFTVPGNNDKTKSKFMISAAEKAGLEEKNVMVVLEMDAAASYCSQQFVCAERSASAKRMSKTSKFGVVDLGGYKTQYCIYEVSEKHNVKPLHSVTCLPVAGETVTESFIRELESMVGKEKWVNFKETNVSDYLDVVRSFEICKRTFNSSTPVVMMEMPETVLSLIESTENDETVTGISFKDDNKITITCEKLSRLFDESLSEIVMNLKSYFKDTVEMVLLVGGFSESSYVREYITKEMGSVPVVLVPTPNLAVLKGAVTMGHENCLRSDCAYGFISMKEITDGHADKKCKGEFKKVICKYEFISPSTFPVECLSIHKTRKHKPLFLYKTKNTDVMYYSTETKKHFSKVGNIVAPECGWSDEIEVQLQLDIVRNSFQFSLRVIN